MTNSKERRMEIQDMELDGEIEEDALVAYHEMLEEVLDYLQKLNEIQRANRRLDELREKRDEVLEQHDPTLLDELQDAESEARFAPREADRAKDDLRAKAKQFYDLTGEINPFDGQGVIVKEHKDHDGTLKVDEGEAVEWAIKNEYKEFLRLKRDDYKEQVARLRLKDMPGEIEYDEPEMVPYIYDDRLREEFGDQLNEEDETHD